jgi:hypothetical protein
VVPSTANESAKNKRSAERELGVSVGRRTYLVILVQFFQSGNPENLIQDGLTLSVASLEVPDQESGGSGRLQLGNIDAQALNMRMPLLDD